MKLTFLGTAAAEGFPAVFCNCQYCNTARQLGGKNIRTRSQSLVNEDLLIDFPADTYAHFLTHNISGHKIRHLLVTHSHLDHLYPAELLMRQTPYGRNMEVAQLQIYCAKGAYDAICKRNPPAEGVQVQLIEPFRFFPVGDYQVCALPARHADGDNAVFYIIKGEKTILYAHDTGYFYEEVFDFIDANGIRFDLITMDCTNVDIPIANTGSHMGIPNITAVVERLTEMGAVDKKTVKYINHFSHNANPLHSVLEERVGPLGYNVSYDGLTVEF